MPDITWPDIDWENIAPAGGRLASACASAGAMLGHSHSNARAFLVAQHGQIVFEQYYHGSTATDRHPVFSITKSVLSLLIGIALQAGSLAGLEQTVTSFFPESPIAADNPLRQVTLRHLLTMTCGIAWPSGGWGAEPMVDRMRRSVDWGQFILKMPFHREKIGVFHYTSAASHLLALILTRACGQTACDYARKRLFDPLGIRNVTSGVDWEADPQGNSIGGWGLQLTARELARIGLLAARNGQWQEKSVVSPDWIEAATHLPEGVPSGYGYQWWLRRIGAEPVTAGQGIGGQYLFCVPRRDLVVVILSQRVHSWPDRWEVLQMLLK